MSDILWTNCCVLFQLVDRFSHMNSLKNLLVWYFARSEWGPYSSGCRFRFRIPNTDPDPEPGFNKKLKMKILQKCSFLQPFLITFLWRIKSVLWLSTFFGKMRHSGLSSVVDPGCLSRIPDPDFYPFRIPILGSRIPDPKTATKERGEKN